MPENRLPNPDLYFCPRSLEGYTIEFVLQKKSTAETTANQPKRVQLRETELRNDKHVQFL